MTFEAGKSQTSSSSNPFHKISEWIVPRHKRAYCFSECSLDDKSFIGGKAAMLCEMNRHQINVPFGFVLSNETYADFQYNQNILTNELRDELVKYVGNLERNSNRVFGIVKREPSPVTAGQLASPLLLSVRVSANCEDAPGKMETLLNLGMNEQIVHALAAVTHDSRFAYDTYRRFLQSYGVHVLGIKACIYETIVRDTLVERNLMADEEFTTFDLQGIVNDFKVVTKIPEDPWEQLYCAIETVYKLWSSDANVTYRDTHGFKSTEYDPAIIIQTMTYGNRDSFSGTGVFTTRNPCNGQKVLTGEYLPMSVGEEMFQSVSAAKDNEEHTTKFECRELKSKDGHEGTVLSLGELQMRQPQAFESLYATSIKLESIFKNVMDVEFTMQNNICYILECRKAKRSAKAAVKFCVDMVNEKLITEREALLRLDPNHATFFENSEIIQTIPNDDVVANSKRKLIGRGKVVSAAGIARGHLVFNENQLMEVVAEGGQGIIVIDSSTTSLSTNVLSTASGFFLSHGHIYSSLPAIQARDVGKCAVSFTEDEHLMYVDSDKNSLLCVTGDVVKRGDVVTLDGFNGTLYLGDVPSVPARLDHDYQTMLEWADKYRKMGVFVNIKDPADLKLAVERGIGDGIGCCRTEGFFPSNVDCEDIAATLLNTECYQTRCKYIDALLQGHQECLFDIFRTFPRRNISFRLLDLPNVHHSTDTSTTYQVPQCRMSEMMGQSEGQIREMYADMRKHVPLHCLRGSKLAVMYPEITIMQTKAIINAAIQASREGLLGNLHFIIPYVMTDHEMEIIAPLIRGTALVRMKQEHCMIDYTIGTSMDVPRACMRADALASEGHVSAMVFDTHSLTQLVFGFSKGEGSHFVPTYKDQHILAGNPFETLDRRGVGSLLQMAVDKIKGANPLVRIGVNGSHGGDPASIYFFNSLKVDYVSVAVTDLAVAKLSAARSHIKGGKALSK